MSRTTKNAPFGTDNTPVLEYKIVAGKRVEVLAQKDTSQHKNENQPTTSSNQCGPHGTPSMSSQPMFRDYEYANLLEGYNTAQQHKVARRISSYTSPFGDRTQSFRHGSQDLNKHPVLPPIENSQPQDSLEATVAHSLRGYNIEKIKDMYVELSSFDRKLTGFVIEPQLGLTTLRHNLPLKLTTMQWLFRQFSDPKHPTKINYEKFLQFLSSCMTNPQLLETNAPKSQDRSLSVPNQDEIRSLAPQELNRISNSVDEKLVAMLKEQLQGCDGIELGKLKQALLNADAERLGNGELQSGIILHACVNARLPLTSSILTHMLQQAEIAHGNVNWRQFLLPLECVCMQLNLKTNDEFSTDQQSSNPALAATRDQSRDEPNGQSSTTTMESDEQEMSSSRKVSLRNQLSAGWDERQPLGSNKPLSSAATTSSNEGRVNSPLRTEAWLRNFTRLAHALRSYHPLKSDSLPRSEVERMVNNYNLIYSLGFSAAHICKALDRSETPDSDSQNPTVSIDLVLNMLSSMAKD